MFIDDALYKGTFVVGVVDDVTMSRPQECVQPTGGQTL